MLHHQSRNIGPLGLALTLVLAPLSAVAEVNPPWTSDRALRLVVRVDPQGDMERAFDERPAEVVLDFTQRLGALGIDRRPDLTTLQVLRCDPNTGAPMKFGRHMHGQTEFDRPFRWYDDAVLYDFPDFQQDIAQTKGEFTYVTRPRWGYFYDVLGDWRRGHLAWVHTQERQEPALYTIYFDLLPPDAEPPHAPPRGWLGDGGHRCEPVGRTSTGQYQTHLALDDWNDDGLVDIVIGCHRGQILWYPNVGTRTEPEFRYAKLVLKADGKPLDMGLHGSPFVTDWNGDGRKDLLVSSIWGGHVNYFENTGTNRDRKLVYRGFVDADGKPITNPFTPVPEAEGPEGQPVFKRDYFGQLQTVDWDGDGDLDLLNGGYVTGRIFFYEQFGKQSDDTPKLTFRGPLEADGKPLDVGWTAAPAAADYDGDGDLDLISGVWPKPGGGGRILEPGEHFLRYFENIGTRSVPQLTQRPLPRQGEFPDTGLTTPGAADWDGDGDLDLIVSDNMNLYLVENGGSPTAPRFVAEVKPLKMPWGSANIPTGVFRDCNDDGQPDIFDDYTVFVNTGDGYPWAFGRRYSFTGAFGNINHPIEQGDGWFFARLADFDGDGRDDVLFGDFHGQVWFHRNLTKGDKPAFDLEGVKVRTADGDPIRVGPGSDAPWDFTTLQGARTRFAAADFNRDGKVDLVVRDTLGKVYYFERVGAGDEPVVAPAVMLMEKAHRGFVVDYDQNGDGWRDVLLPMGTGRDTVLLNAAGRGEAVFLPPKRVQRPPIPVMGTITNVAPVDLNGDGDEDLVVTNGYQFSSYFERSFLDHGYAQGRVLRVERRPDTATASLKE